MDFKYKIDFSRECLTNNTFLSLIDPHKDDYGYNIIQLEDFIKSQKIVSDNLYSGEIKDVYINKNSNIPRATLRSNYKIRSKFKPDYCYVIPNVFDVITNAAYVYVETSVDDILVMFRREAFLYGKLCFNADGNTIREMFEISEDDIFINKYTNVWYSGSLNAGNCNTSDIIDTDGKMKLSFILRALDAPLTTKILSTSSWKTSFTSEASVLADIISISPSKIVYDTQLLNDHFSKVPSATEDEILSCVDLIFSSDSDNTYLGFKILSEMNYSKFEPVVYALINTEKYHSSKKCTSIRFMRESISKNSGSYLLNSHGVIDPKKLNASQIKLMQNVINKHKTVRWSWTFNQVTRNIPKDEN